MSAVSSIVGAITQPIKTVTEPLTSLLGGSSSSTAGTATSSTDSTAATGTQATINNAQQSLVGDQQTFLTLLTAQLKNQDPLSPMDTNQFTQQLVVMTGVQQQILTNQLLEQMVNQKGAVTDPVSLIGKTVTADTPNAALQSGSAKWLYSLGGSAKDVSLQVVDSLGHVVAQSDAGAQTAGEQSFSWNGKDMQGVQRTDGGTYTLKVTATDASGQAVTTDIYQRGVAGGVETASGQSLVDLNGQKIPVSSVTAVGSTA